MKEKPAKQDAQDAEREAVAYILSHFSRIGGDSKARVPSQPIPDKDYDAAITALYKVHHKRS